MIIDIGYILKKITPLFNRQNNFGGETVYYTHKSFPQDFEKLFARLKDNFKEVGLHLDMDRKN